MCKDVLIKHVTVGKWKENSYLIECGHDAWLIDPGDSFDLVDEKFKTADKNILGIINTHGHFDHIGAVHQFKTKYNLKFFIHSKDKQIVRQANLYRRLAGDNTVFTTPDVDGFLDDIGELNLAGKRIIVHHTPGHSHGSVCFEIDKCLISGDVLFKDAVGRTDLPGGNLQLLSKSIDYITHHFIGYQIYPGHGEPFLLDGPAIRNIKELL